MSTSWPSASEERPRAAYQPGDRRAEIVRFDGVTDADLHAAGRAVSAEHGDAGEIDDAGGIDGDDAGDRSGRG